jgi:AcrR family transcriptional regulator
MAAPRLTRKERQALTRSSLIESANRVFSERGMQGASIDEVAEHAGFTKGAFYANFKSKEELFLAMLDERFAELSAELDSTVGPEGEPEDQAREAGLNSDRYVAANEEWERLFFEFAAYAGRNPEFREELVDRYRGLRKRIAAIMGRRAQELGIQPPLPLDQIALMTFAMANGAALERVLEPEAVPEDLYGKMLEIFFAGLRTMVDEPPVALS